MGIDGAATTISSEHRYGGSALNKLARRAEVPLEQVLNNVSPAADDGTSFIGNSRAILDVKEEIRRIANIEIPVLILGETGTGKEVVARIIHKLSYRAHRSFLKVNCAALPTELLESELFGHEAGAFTGANRFKPGKFEICNHGTLFLDEVGEIPIGPQAKLLHALQDGEFSKLGSSSTTKVDVRVIAATNVDIPKAIISKKFRADLYYRLNAYTIHLPPLRERKDDIPLLLEHFMKLWGSLFGRPTRISDAALEACLSYSWPGNIRELENFVRRYIISNDEAKSLSELRTESSPKNIVPSDEASSRRVVPGDLKMQIRNLKLAAEKEAIVCALKLTNGSRKEAAKLLNISIRALQYKLRECEIGLLEGAAPASDPYSGEVEVIDLDKSAHPEELQ